jgi:hypothetical protein
MACIGAGRFSIDATLRLLEREGDYHFHAAGIDGFE